MNGSYRKICSTYETWISVYHRELPQLRFPWADFKHFNKYCSIVSSSYLPVNRDRSIHQRLDIERLKKNAWVLPTLVMSAMYGFTKEAFQVNGNCSWLRNIENTLSNSLNLYVPSSDFKEMQEQGLKKINEAQEVLQKRLTKAREESKNVADKAEKQALEVMIKSTEESIDQLLELKKKMKAELKKRK